MPLTESRDAPVRNETAKPSALIRIGRVLFGGGAALCLCVALLGAALGEGGAVAAIVPGVMLLLLYLLTYVSRIF